ncbi:MAG: hypothetical protein Q9M92_10430 [Enterobacterales bacterium]|nr:hypothetical protein [Enterobacterales bacterium]
MLINHSASALEQKTQYQTILIELDQIAHHTIDTPIFLRDQVEEKLMNSIYQQDFDALFGGCVIQQPDCFHSKPLLYNLYLSDIYLTASRVLFNGQLRLVGQQILDYLNELFIQSKRPVNQSLKLEDLNHFFTRQQINQHLTGSEKNLFFSLIKQQPDSRLSEQQGFCYYNKRSLYESAKFIGMDLKQAQILEYSLQQKLKNLVKDSSVNSSTKADNQVRLENKKINDIQPKMQFIINRCKENFTNNRILQLDSIRPQLVGYLLESNLNIALKTQVFYASLFFLQLDFDKKIVACLKKYWQEDFCKLDDKRLFKDYPIELAAIHYFSQAFFELQQPESYNSDKVVDFKPTPQSKAVETNGEKMKGQIILFKKNDLTCLEKISRLRAEYQLHRFVFVL